MIQLKKILSLLLTGLLFLFALLLTFYPILSSRYNKAHQTKARAEYEEILAQTDTEEFDRLRRAAVAYNKSLIPGVSTEGYSEEYLLSASEDYVNQLAVSGSEIMGYVEIPKIQVYLPIYHGTGADSLERGEEMIRQLVHTVKVVSKNHIQVYLTDGTEVEQTVAEK